MKSCNSSAKEVNEPDGDSRHLIHFYTDTVGPIRRLDKPQKCCRAGKPLRGHEPSEIISDDGVFPQPDAGHSARPCPAAGARGHHWSSHPLRVESPPAS